MTNLEHNTVQYYRVGRRFFLEPPTRTKKLAEHPDRRVWLVEYNECYSPRVLRKLRRGNRMLEGPRNNKGRPTSKVRRKLEKAGRKAARR